MQFIETWISMWYDSTGKANYEMERKKETDMYNIRKLLMILPGSEQATAELALFENIFPIKRGVSYNSYVLLDEQTVLLIPWMLRCGTVFRKPGSCLVREEH